MNLGQLDAENEQFMNDYKKLGYSTKTQLANEAITLLRRQKERERRAHWLAEAFDGLKGSTPDVAFESIEGDDFASEDR